jgi:hypothetical protein
MVRWKHLRRGRLPEQSDAVFKEHWRVRGGRRQLNACMARIPKDASAGRADVGRGNLPSRSSQSSLDVCGVVGDAGRGAALRQDPQVVLPSPRILIRTVGWDKCRRRLVDKSGCLMGLCETVASMKDYRAIVGVEPT